jgi:hypothetical protein
MQIVKAHLYTFFTPEQSFFIVFIRVASKRANQVAFKLKPLKRCKEGGDNMMYVDVDV